MNKENKTDETLIPVVYDPKIMEKQLEGIIDCSSMSKKEYRKFKKELSNIYNIGKFRKLVNRVKVWFRW